MVAETVGHFFGGGPLAATHGSPHTIGGFEAHGFAIIIGTLLLRALVSGESIPSPIFTLCKSKSMARRLKTPNGHEVDKTGRSPHVYRLNQQTVPDG
jgi:hypothetical protein